MTLELYELLDCVAGLFFRSGTTSTRTGTVSGYGDWVNGIDEDAMGAALGVDPMALGVGFSPFRRGRCIHPSAADEPDEAARWRQACCLADRLSKP